MRECLLNEIVLCPLCGNELWFAEDGHCAMEHVTVDLSIAHAGGIKKRHLDNSRSDLSFFEGDY